MDTKTLDQGNRPIIKWLELAISPRWKQPDAAAVVHPMHVGEHPPCFGLTLDRRWLCSSDGALTVFESTSAAVRFLRLLNINHPAIGEARQVEASAPSSFQCLHLDSRGLAICRKCRAGDNAYWLAAWNDMQSEEAW